MAGSFHNWEQRALPLTQGPITGLYVETGDAVAGTLAAGSGDRRSDFKVTFKKAFSVPPVVQVNLRLIHLKPGKDVAAQVWADNITTTDFTVHIGTFSDAEAVNIQASWFAIGTAQ